MTEWVSSLAVAFLLVPATAAAKAVGQEPFITVASTTSPEESEMFSYLLSLFTKETAIEIRLVEVGTGQALKIGEHGDCDVVFIRGNPEALAFVEHGFGIDRSEVMYSDFILVGPKRDPAHVDGGEDIVVSFRKIADTNAPFLARGDNSDTSKAEMPLEPPAGSTRRGRRVMGPETGRVGAGWSVSRGVVLGQVEGAFCLHGSQQSININISVNVRLL